VVEQEPHRSFIASGGGADQGRALERAGRDIDLGASVEQELKTVGMTLPGGREHGSLKVSIVARQNRARVGISAPV
jgi:hypothetical protein